MKKRNMIISCALALTITGVLSQTANATTNGWKQSNGGWCYYQNNSLKTGWIQDGGKWYYISPSSGVMQNGWVNDGGTWYYLDVSGAMLYNTTVGIYVLGSTGACVNPNGESTTQSQTGTLVSTKTTSEIKEILKNEYGFVDYNNDVLLNPNGKNRSHDGGYVDDQIIFREIARKNMQQILLLKHDSKTMNAFKNVLNVMFSDKVDEAYSLLTNYTPSEKDTTYTFYGKTITIYATADSKTIVYCVQ